jgi:hypothetical protein
LPRLMVLKYRFSLSYPSISLVYSVSKLIVLFNPHALLSEF